MGLITKGFDGKTHLATKDEIDELKPNYLTYPDGMMYKYPEYKGVPIPLKKCDDDEGDE